MDETKRQNGQAFILVLILLGIGAVLIVPFLQTATSALQKRDQLDEYIKESYAADAAIEYGMWRLKFEENFAKNLPVGSESDPFWITLNGYEASTTIVAQANSGQLSGQDLGGRAENDIYFKVNKSVIASSSYLVIAGDDFESANPNGGTGSWLGGWTLNGSSDITSAAPYEGGYCLRLQGHSSTGDGYVEREANLSGATGEGPYLHFWASVSSFESTDNDEAYLRVSVNGTSWDLLDTWTWHDSNGQYNFYQYDLSAYGKPSSFYISFQVDGDNDSDTIRIDELRLSETQEVAVVEPGVLTEYTYFVSLQCMDPDGCKYVDYWNNAALDSMVDYLPERGAASGDWMRYIPGSTVWDFPVFDQYAFDGFEDGISGGTGPWSGSWTLTGDASITTDSEYEGDYCLRLRGYWGGGDGYAKREIDLSGVTDDDVYFYFVSRLYGLQYGETVSVKASVDGVEWDVLDVFSWSDSDNQYHVHYYDISSYGKPDTFYIAFDMASNGNNRIFRVDNIEFTSFQGAGSGQWPMEPFDPVWMDEGGGETRYQKLTWDFENAGYDEIPFEYGEIKTLQFKAEAALTEGVYCNQFLAHTGSGGFTNWLDPEIAKITVGDPLVTSCEGGLLDINKTVSPLVIYPNELTTVNYTITIENVDVVPITIYQIEDYLPTTGDEDPEDSFVYVDNSASGRIISRDSIPIMFDDAFNRWDSSTVTYWTDSDGGGWDASLDNEQVYLRENASITQYNISTANYTDIVFSYRWEGDAQSEYGDVLRVEWKPSSSGSWNLLADHPMPQSYWHNEEWDLPVEAEDTEIDIKFTGISNNYNEQARVDDVEVTSGNYIDYTPVCMPDDNEGNDFFQEYWWWDSRRWELDWLFENYPGPYDSVWDNGSLCANYPYNNYDPYLLLNPGEIFEITFSAEVTLVASGSYYNEVFVKITPGWWGDWMYSWPTGGVTVPQYDLEGSTLNSILRANAMLNPWGFWWISWHWWKYR